MRPIGPREGFQKSSKPPNLGWGIPHPTWGIPHPKITNFGVKMLYLGRFWADFDDFFDFFGYNCHSELIEIRFGYRIAPET